MIDLSRFRSDPLPGLAFWRATGLPVTLAVKIALHTDAAELEAFKGVCDRLSKWKPDLYPALTGEELEAYHDRMKELTHKVKIPSRQREPKVKP